MSKCCTFYKVRTYKFNNIAGQYQNTSLFDDQIKLKKGYSISSKPPPEAASCVPGPNAYFKDDNTKKIRPSSAM